MVGNYMGLSELTSTLYYVHLLQRESESPQALTGNSSQPSMEKRFP